MRITILGGGRSFFRGYHSTSENLSKTAKSFRKKHKYNLQQHCHTGRDSAVESWTLFNARNPESPITNPESALGIPFLDTIVDLYRDTTRVRHVLSGGTASDKQWSTTLPCSEIRALSSKRKTPRPFLEHINRTHQFYQCNNYKDTQKCQNSCTYCRRTYSRPALFFEGLVCYPYFIEMNITMVPVTMCLEERPHGVALIS